MRSSVPDVVTVLAVAGLSALGGAAIVFSEFDDAPGGILGGILLVVAGAALDQKERRLAPATTDMAPPRTRSAIGGMSTLRNAALSSLLRGHAAATSERGAVANRSAAPPGEPVGGVGLRR